MWEKYSTARQITDDNTRHEKDSICISANYSKNKDTHSLIFLFHVINGNANAPNCYVIRTLPVLLMLNLALTGNTTL